MFLGVYLVICEKWKMLNLFNFLINFGLMLLIFDKLLGLLFGVFKVVGVIFLIVVLFVVWFLVGFVVFLGLVLVFLEGLVFLGRIFRIFRVVKFWWWFFLWW